MAVGDIGMEHIESIVIDDVNTYYAMDARAVSQDFKHLHIRVEGRWNNSSGATYPYIWFGEGGSVNNGAVYNRGTHNGYMNNGTASSGYGDSGGSVGYLGEGLTNTSHGTGFTGVIYGDIVNYSNSSVHSSLHYHSWFVEDTASTYWKFARGWVNYKVASALNVVYVQATSGSTNFQVGSRLDIWGYNN